MRKTFTITLCMAFLITNLSGLFALSPVCASESGDITNAVFQYYNATEKKIEKFSLGTERFVTPGFSAPVFQSDGISDPTASGYYSTSNLVSWFQMFGDTNGYQNNYLYEVPDELKTSTYIRLNRNWRGTRTDTTNNLNAMASQTEVLSFQINKTAAVYYIYPNSAESTIAANAPWLTSEDWTVEGTVKFVESNGGTENPQPKEFLLLKKVYQVADGETSDVKIGGYHQNYFVPMVSVRWIDDPTELASVSNMKFKQYDGTSVNTVDVSASSVITTGFTAPVYKSGDGAITDPAQSGYYSVQNMTSWFKMFADTNYSQYSYFYNIPAYIQDSTYFRLTRAWREPRTNPNTPNAMNAQSEVFTFDIDSTANIYYVFPSLYASFMPDYAKWLGEEGWTLCDEKVQIVESTNASGENPQIKNYLLYRKKFIVTPGQTQNIKIGGFYQNYFVPLVFVDWVNENITKNISVSVIGNGTVDKPGNQDVEKGGTFSITATPDEGYTIEYIKFNGIEVQYNTANTYTTPSINDDATIEVKFKEASSVPEVTTAAAVFNFLDDATNLPCGITFATAVDIEGYTIQEYGIVFSETDDTPTIEEGAIRYRGLVSRNQKGQFGIKLYGSGLKVGKTYYTTPYAVYSGETGEEELVVYGSSTSFTPVGQVYGVE